MKIRVALLMTGMAVLTACHRRSPAAEAVQTNAAALEASLENRAATLEAEANDDANRSAADAMRNAADQLHDERGNVANAADVTLGNMR
ncbi:hypothetical protein [Sphingomonas sp.]|uniref:hypothetical protein n=1 Tax=Sphingomonas sp. TaxID=28214 RepID=UPI003CC5D2E3